MTDAEPARAHVRALMVQGMGWKRVAKVAGLSESTVYPLLYGKHVHQPDHPEHRPPRKQILKTNAEALLAAQIDKAAGVYVEATGTRRRIEALVTAGWPMSALAEHMGIDHQRIRGCVSGRHEKVTEDTRRAVAKFFRSAIHGPGTVVTETSQNRARRYAAQRGWAPALAWDDIDDPAATPDVTVLRPRAKKVSLEQRIADVEDLASFGEGASDETAQRAGWPSRDTMLKALNREGRADLIARLQSNDLRDDRRRA